MLPAQFEAGIDEYIRLCGSGLKKRANQLLQDHMTRFADGASDEEKDAVYIALLRMICDTEKGRLLTERGNGRLPYALYEPLREYLMACYYEGRMPHMRWFYELYRNDAECHAAAHDALERAFHHEQCCIKTARLYLCAEIELLAFGAHHFPDGCCIEQVEYKTAFKRCKEVLLRYEDLDNYISLLRYYRALYGVWEKYCASGRQLNFFVLCAEAGIEFPTKNQHINN